MRLLLSSRFSTRLPGSGFLNPDLWRPRGHSWFVHAPSWPGLGGVYWTTTRKRAGALFGRGGSLGRGAFRWRRGQPWLVCSPGETLAVDPGFSVHVFEGRADSEQAHICSSRLVLLFVPCTLFHLRTPAHTTAPRGF